MRSASGNREGRDVSVGPEQQTLNLSLLSELWSLLCAVRLCCLAVTSGHIKQLCFQVCLGAI